MLAGFQFRNNLLACLAVKCIEPDGVHTEHGADRQQQIDHGTDPRQRKGGLLNFGDIIHSYEDIPAQGQAGADPPVQKRTLRWAREHAWAALYHSAGRAAMKNTARQVQKSDRLS